MRNLLLTLLLACLPATGLAAQRTNTPGGLDPTKLPLTGGTLTGPLTISTPTVRALTTLGNDPHSGVGALISMPQYSTSTLSLVDLRAFGVVANAGQAGFAVSESSDPVHSGALGFLNYDGSSLNWNFSNGKGGGGLSANDDGTVRLFSKKTASVQIVSNDEIHFQTGASTSSVYQVDSTSSVIVNSGSGAQIYMTGVGSPQTDVAGALSVSGSLSIGLVTVSNACAVGTTCQAICTGTTLLLGGGCQVPGSFLDSYPAASNTWQCDTSAPASITAYAICARLGP
jgi:hypothetical protein